MTRASMKFPIVLDPQEKWADGENLDGLYGKEAMQRALCLDFDGVLHAYRQGWKGHGRIYDEPVEGAVEACDSLIEAGWSLYVLTSRAHLEPVQRWLFKNRFPSMILTRIKPIAVAYIDDRAIRFEGNWPATRKMFA